MLIRVLLTIVVSSSVCLGCPKHPDPPCTCRLIGFHSSVITCMDVENEITLEKSLQSMRSTEIPINTVQIYNTNVNFLPSKLFRGLEVPKLIIADCSIVSLSDTETAFEGLEDSLETLVVQRTVLYRGWIWSQLRGLRALTELTLMNAGLQDIDEDIQSIAHLNITLLQLTKDSLTYIGDTAFATFHNLVTLSLKDNMIQSVKRSMFPDPADQLKTIILSNNQLEFVPADLFSDMPALKSIALANNKLITVDEAAFKPVWNNLKDLDVLGNPLRCDCRMSWFLKLNFPRNTWAQCEEPLRLKGVAVQKLARNELWC